MWKKANPSLDKTIGMDKVVAACNSAKETPGEENAFRQLRLNQWVKQAVRWMPMEKWDKCKVAFDEDMLAGRVCYGGLDLSSTTDITAFVLVFPPTDEDEHYYVLPYFWLPEETLPLRVRRDHVPYDVREMLSIMVSSRISSMNWGRNFTSKRLLLTVGVRYRCRRTWRGLGLQWFSLDRVIRICHRQPKN